MGRKSVVINPIRGRNLQRLLSEHGMTQQELADKIGYTKEHISYVVCGRRNLTEGIANDIIQKVFPAIRKEFLLGLDEFETEADIKAAQRQKMNDDINTIFKDGNIVLEFLKFVAKSRGYELTISDRDMGKENEKGELIITIDSSAPYCTLRKGDEILSLSCKQVHDLCNNIFLHSSFIFDKDVLNKFDEGGPFWF